MRTRLIAVLALGLLLSGCEALDEQMDSMTGDSPPPAAAPAAPDQTAGMASQPVSSPGPAPAYAQSAVGQDPYCRHIADGAPNPQMQATFYNDCMMTGPGH